MIPPGPGAGPGAVTAAAAAAGLAVLLWLPPRSVGRPPRHGAAVPVTPVLAGVAVLATVLVPGRAALVGVLALAGAGGVRLWRAGRARTAATAVSMRVLETCELLAAELGAGQPPGRALERAAGAWPPLDPVAEAFRVGADVPVALRHAARARGAADLRLLAAAWQVAHRTGQGLAEAVEAIATDLRAAAATRGVVAGELASARATARLVAVLPLLALAMGSGAGGDPWHFLLAEPAGLACLAAGLGFGLAGLAWIEAIAARVERAR